MRVIGVFKEAWRVLGQLAPQQLSLVKLYAKPKVRATNAVIITITGTNRNTINNILKHWFKQNAFEKTE